MEPLLDVVDNPKIPLNDVLGFIKGHIERERRPPSYREIASRFNVAPSTAWRYVQALEAHRLVSIEPGSRGILIEENASR